MRIALGKVSSVSAAFVAALLATSALAASAPPPKGAPAADLIRRLKLPYTSFTLPNGLRVVVNTDRSAPLVSVAVWYHVGSKNEPAGRTGFAHLYEHLMFGGSENNDRSWFEPMQALGATDLNGTTYFDRTNYFETVPKGALERTLYLESDRMGHLLGAITQTKLDTQRGVVQNEKRQGDNQPGGLVKYEITQTIFPETSPYHHTPIGSMADLDTASLDTVKDWFRAHYGPNNAVIALSGDISAEEARTLATKYFGDIPRGPETVQPTPSVPTLPAPVKKLFRDQVGSTTFHRVWVVPGTVSPELPAINAAVSVLGGLASSRLDNQLVRGSKTAIQATASVQEMEQASLVSFSVTLREGVDPGVLERQFDQVIADFIKSGPTATELDRVKTVAAAGATRGLESSTAKASTLAEGMTYANDPGYLLKELDATAKLTTVEVAAAARKWLTRPVFAYTLMPGARGAYQEAAEVASSVPVAKAAPVAKGDAPKPRAVPLPPVGPIADLSLPPVERTTLSNGIPVEFLRSAQVPVVRIAVRFDAGFAADPKARLGEQMLSLSAMAEGTDRYDGAGLADAREAIGAEMSTDATLDRTGVSMTALSANLPQSVDLFADVVRHPAFRPDDVERLRARQLANIVSEMKQPNALAYRVLPPLLYGKEHPYGLPFTGTGDPRMVAHLSADDAQAFHDTWMRADTARLYVVGDTTLAAIKPLLEKSFGDWRSTGPKPVKDFAVPTPKAGGRILFVDRPDSPQSLILGGALTPVKGTQDLVPLGQANKVLGGTFLSRLNMDLREQKHWAYGVSSLLSTARETMPFFTFAPVQANQTGPSIAAMRDDMHRFLTSEGVTADELRRTIDGAIRALPSQYDSGDALLGMLISNETFGRPDNYANTLPSRYRTLTAADLDRAARAAIDPDKIVWVVIGDKAKVMDQLTKLGLPIETLGAAPPAPAAKPAAAPAPAPKPAH